MVEMHHCSTLVQLSRVDTLHGDEAMYLCDDEAMYLRGGLLFIAQELVELAGHRSVDNCLNSTHLADAIQQDEELKVLLNV